jgi:hypothetical protein
MKPDDIVTEAKKRFELARNFYAKERALAVADTKFVMGDSDNGWQWPDDIKSGREIDKRVCLTVNTTAQHCNQIINNIRSNRPAVKVSPADNGADKKTAEIIAGLVRNIQVASGSDEAHDTAAEHSIYGGEGYWRVVTEYESPTSFNQVIRIIACPNPGQVFIDPNCKQADKSDAKWGFIFDDISIEQAKREHKDIKPQSWGEIDNQWVKEETVRRAEYFYCTEKSDVAVMLEDGSTVLKSEMPEGAVVALNPRTGEPMERPTKVESWKWCKLLGGHDKPLEEREWLGKYLPIIAVTGKEVNVAGQVVRKGIVRDLKDPARMVNFAYSETVQTLALQNKVPYMAAVEAIEGHEDIWGSANIDTRAYLPWNAFDDAGNPLPKPSREPPAVMPAAQVQLLQLSTEQMRAASGQQNANFGIKSEAASGIGIQRLKAQGEIATFHFPDNLARALRYEAKVLIDLIQKYYDTKRVVRILGLDGAEESAILDPEMEGAYAETQDAEIQKIFNPLVGEYDVVIDTGPSYHTQRQEGAANLNELAAKNPALMQIAGDLIMRAQDFPMASELADRLAKTLPPELQDKKPGQQEQDPQMMAQMEQMGQQIEAMSSELNQCVDALKQKDKEVMTLETKIHAETNKRMSLELDLERVEALAEIEQAMQSMRDESNGEPEVQQAQPQQPQQSPVVLVDAQGQIAQTLAPMMQEFLGGLAESVGNTGAAVAVLAEGQQALMQEMSANTATTQALLAEQARPKQSQVRIVKQADGSFVGEKIEA